MPQNVSFSFYYGIYFVGDMVLCVSLQCVTPYQEPYGIKEYNRAPSFSSIVNFIHSYSIIMSD